MTDHTGGLPQRGSVGRVETDEAVAAHADRATVRPRVVPRAPQTGPAGRHAGTLKPKVNAPPVGGASNDEVCRFLAGKVGVRPSEVSIPAGGRRARP